MSAENRVCPAQRPLLFAPFIRHHPVHGRADSSDRRPYAACHHHLCDACQVEDTALSARQMRETPGTRPRHRSTRVPVPPRNPPPSPPPGRSQVYTYIYIFLLRPFIIMRIHIYIYFKHIVFAVCYGSSCCCRPPILFGGVERLLSPTSPVFRARIYCPPVYIVDARRAQRQLLCYHP